MINKFVRMLCYRMCRLCIFDRLILGAIQTGLFSTLFAIGNLIVFNRFPKTNLYILFNWPVGRIYTNVRSFHLVMAP